MAAKAQKIPFDEVAAPSTPATGEVVIYAKSDGLMYSKDDAGAETLMSSGAGAAAHIADTTDAHDASAVSFDPTGLDNTSATEVQTALEDFDAAITAAGGGAASFAGVRVRAVADVALTQNSLTFLTFDTEDYDTDGYHSTVSETTKLKVPAGKAGYYRIYASSFTTDTPGNGYCAIRLNGTTIIATGSYWAGTNIGAMTANTTYHLVQDDYVEFGIRVSNTSKSAIDGGVADPVFGMELVGA